MIEGRSFFENLNIGWFYTEDYGLTVTDIRCGVCELPVQSFAINVKGTIYLTCADGHLVGTAHNPHEAYRAYHSSLTDGQSRSFTNRQMYNNHMFEIIQRFKSQFDIKAAVSSKP